MAALGLAWRRLPTTDRTAPAHDDLEAARTSTGEATVYVHCAAGISRSPTFAMALLVRRGMTLAEAHRRVTNARPAAAPNTEQLAWLAEVEAREGSGPA